jgi:hypothetical protein
VASNAESLGSDRDAPSLPVPRPRSGRVFGGGASGNEQLTTLAGAVLLVLLAALGVTIVRIGGLLNEHMFLGMLLLGPVALKISSTPATASSAITRPTRATGPRVRRPRSCARSRRSW